MRRAVALRIAQSNNASSSTVHSAATHPVQRDVVSSAEVARRLVSLSPPAAPTPRTPTTPVIPPTTAAPAAPPDTTTTTTTATTTARDDTLSTTALLDRVDEMMSRLEERILEELERRGGRFTGYF